MSFDFINKFIFVGKIIFVIAKIFVVMISKSKTLEEVS